MNKYNIEKFDWDTNYLNCLWNDGLMAKIHTPKGEYCIFANGEVKGSLITKTNIITNEGDSFPKGIEIATVKGTGISFYHEMSNYIKDDEELASILCGNHPFYLLDLQNNNWLEMDLINNNGEYEELDIVLDSCTLNEAVEEVIKMIPSVEKDLEISM